MVERTLTPWRTLHMHGAVRRNRFTSVWEAFRARQRIARRPSKLKRSTPVFVKGLTAAALGLRMSALL